MSTTHIEYANGLTLDRASESRAAILARAPAWWREAVLRDAAASAGASSQAKPAAPAPAKQAKPQTFAGWIAGVCCPGVSEPAWSDSDRRRLPEQFTDRAWDMMYRQWTRGTATVVLTWKHDGVTMATTRDLSLALRYNALVGLEFEARLQPGKWADHVLGLAERDGLGVSVGYVIDKYWHVEREGRTIRVVDEARLHHIALIPDEGSLRPCFAGARAFGLRGNRLGCPPDCRVRAEQFAYRLLKQQAGVPS